MKKAKLLGFGLCVVMFTASLVSCANGADSSSSDTTPAATPAPAATTPAGGSGGGGSGGSGGNGGGGTGANQTLINNAAEGTSITLDPSAGDTQLTINRALTVNGNGVSGVTVTVSPSVARNVTLRNFTNSNIRVANVSNTNSSINTVNNGVFSSVRSVFGGIFRSDNGSTGGATTTGSTDEKFKKVGDDAVPLKLEGCTGVNIEAEAKLALQVDNGQSKSIINEIKLKDGAEDFTFIEIDKADKPETDANEATATNDKTKVVKLSIEYSDKQNESEKINLIGGTFDDVSLTNNYTGEIDFKYDKEFADQLNFSGKDTFLGDTKIKEKDIGNADKTATTGNVYSYTMSKSDFAKVNGYLTIIFMTTAQKQWMDAHGGDFRAEGPRHSPSTFYDQISCATMENPIYMMIPAGFFKVADV